MSFLWKRNWDPKGKHCYITGGSSGLGLALALLLVARGAHVSLVGRSATKLAAALAQLEAARVAPDQVFTVSAHDLVGGVKEAEEALDAVGKPFEGRTPDASFLCAGAWAPRYWIESTEAQLREGMDGGYWIQAWTALALSKRMVRQRRTGKIVLVSSMLGYIAVPGWGAYTPAKHALRGLADTLRWELALYDIDVQLFSPPTMPTPGYANEALTKPPLTAKIEEADEGMSAEAAARGMLRGVQRGNAHITADVLGNIFRAGTRGAAPGNNWFVDSALDVAHRIAVPIWRMSVDRIIRAHKAEHWAHLEATGFVDPVALSTAAAATSVVAESSSDGQKD